ncbi:PEP-CTERM sorting domain-containing protein [bacterium]|nr:PEP-CTERM sorting domain-containing protein [bacterium]MDB4377945.1 PEP-CTERM sorting domain-containing protein [Akkermansiaceae bacterium]
MLTPIAVCLAVGGTSSLNAAVITDDFSAGLAAWAPTVILDNNGGGSNTSAFQVNGSNQLELNTTAYDGIEQLAYIRNGAVLNIGEEAQLDMNTPISGNRNIGLYIGGTAPSAGVRVDYISVYAGSTGNPASRVFQRGFDGTSEYTNLLADPTTSSDMVFIARTAANTFETGFYEGGVRTIISTLTPGTANTADFVGLYADVRATGIVSANIDEFRIVTAVPEPSTALLGALGALGLLRRRR